MGKISKENMSLSEMKKMEEKSFRNLIVKYHTKRLNGKALVLEVECWAVIVIFYSSANDFHQLY